MEAVEFTGKTTEDALIQAQAHFGLPLDKLEVEVLSAGSGGLFGLLGAKKAKVRVRPLGVDQEAADQIAELMRVVSGEAKPASPSAGSQAPAAPPPSRFHAAPAAPVRPLAVAPRPQAAPAPPARKPAGPAAQTPPPPASPEFPDVERNDLLAISEDDGPVESAGQVEPPEVVELAREILSRLVAPLDAGATIGAQAGDPAEGILLSVDGEEVGVLIGRRGQTLDALQYLTTRIVSHKQGRPVRLEVDAGHYRRRRQESLEDLARRMADKAHEAGRPISLGPFNSQDRRVVHMALKDRDGIATLSRGRGELKKVVIQPR